MKPKTWVRYFRRVPNAFSITITVLCFLIASALPGRASLPGANGRIAYGRAAFAHNESAIFLSGTYGGGQFTVPPLETNPYYGTPYQDIDESPAWSPDGSQLAFARYHAINMSIEIINRDGTGERTVFVENQNESAVADPVWSPDGKKIAFIEVTNLNSYAIDTINADGANFQQIANAVANPASLSWSSQGDLAFICDVPTGAPNQNTRGICVLQNGTLHQILVKVPEDEATCTQGLNCYPTKVYGIDWSPDGRTLVLAAESFAIGANGHIIQNYGVFRINEDGTGLKQLTPRAPDLCPNVQAGPDVAPMWYFHPVVSPDGNWIAVAGQKINVSASGPYCSSSYGPSGIWLMPATGGEPSLSISTNDMRPFSWQPLPQALSFRIFDGHDNPLKGMKVELLHTDDTLIDDQPINTAGGTYVFQDALPAGDYSLKATLTDRCSDPCTPAFDIRYAPVPDEAAWLEWRFTIKTSAQPALFLLNWDENDPLLETSNMSVDAFASDRFDDVADIYFRVRQYVDWIKANATPDTGSTAQFYTFATADPVDGTPLCPANTSGNVPRACAYYIPGTSKIVMSDLASDYENRDGIADAAHDNDGPENVEWHEYTHHVYEAFVHDLACTGDTNHKGYDNPNTCDSMQEGFAVFLPAYAARDILGTTSSYYDTLWDLAWPTKAWGYRGPGLNTEDLAVASLFWDLTAGTGDSQASAVIGADGLPSAAVYNNSMFGLSIQQLWTDLTTAHPATVADLHDALGHTTATIDLDGDGHPDVTPTDIPFLMHGFYPIVAEETEVGSSKADFFDLRHPQVGQSDHVVYNADGTIYGTIEGRRNITENPHANIALTVLDASGLPLDGATVHLTINYPGGQSLLTRKLATGSGALVHLELPAYFDYQLADGAPLPACDPLHDVHVTVALSVEKHGTFSTQTPTFDNCTYLHAVVAANTPAAMSFTFNVPVTGGIGIPPTTTAALAPQPNAAGWNHTSVSVTLTAVDNTGGSGVKQIDYSASGAQTISDTAVPGASATFSINNEGQTTVTFFGTDNDGASETTNQLVISIDKTYPAVTCGNADGHWHATDVALGCAATDALSGLANALDANFTVSTAVPAGTETANASTVPQTICDVAGNCVDAGDISGNMIDKKPPQISIAAPVAGTYLLNQFLTANYSCTDNGSGVATCAGPVPNSAGVNTSAIGSSTFTVNATDNVGNATSQETKYAVAYKICTLYDPVRSVQSGSTIPLRLQLCDANNVDVSSASVAVRATGLTLVSSDSSAVVQDAGNANPNGDFRYDSTLGGAGGYIFNLSTRGLQPGVYSLSFTAGNDPTIHTVGFQVR